MTDDNTIQQLAKEAWSGDHESFLVLQDALEEMNHPLLGYVSSSKPQDVIYGVASLVGLRPERKETRTVLTCDVEGLLKGDRLEFGPTGCIFDTADVSGYFTYHGGLKELSPITPSRTKISAHLNSRGDAISVRIPAAATFIVKLEDPLEDTSNIEWVAGDPAEFFLDEARMCQRMFVEYGEAVFDLLEPLQQGLELKPC